MMEPGSIRNQDENIIPADLEEILWGISEKIPVCIVSSKDFVFLQNRTRFANIISCILGIETLVMKSHRKTTLRPPDSREDVSPDETSECQDFRCIKSSYVSVDDTTLQYNSKLLSQLAKEIASCFKEVSIEHKFTVTGQKVLAGIDWRHIDIVLCIDWRQIDDWKSFKVKSEPKLRRAVIEKQRRIKRSWLLR